jgi:antitoxin FitA
VRARPYDLRHGFASLLIAEGRLSIIEIASQLGHNPTVCLGIYGHEMGERADSGSSAEDLIRAARHCHGWWHGTGWRPNNRARASISSMRTIQIRNVPDGLHRSLKQRAAREGTTLSDLILRHLPQLARKPSPEDVLQRSRSRTPGPPAAELIRSERSEAW